MRATRVPALCGLLALFGVLGALPSASAQGPSYAPPRPAAATVGTEAEGDTLQASTGLSSWITYSDRGACCHGSGGSTPIGTEWFLQVGPSFPIGDEIFARALDTGWSIKGGARALFFNQSYTRAWSVDGGLSHTYNHGSGDAANQPININGFVLTLREYHRTFVNLGGGRDWYVFGTSAVDPGRKVRVGLDAGGRYGNGSAEFPQIPHITDVMGGAYVGFHGDVEWPWCRCVFVLGARGEYAYTWSDILDGPSDMQEFNLLFNVGVRY